MARQLTLTQQADRLIMQSRVPGEPIFAYTERELQKKDRFRRTRLHHIVGEAAILAQIERDIEPYMDAALPDIIKSARKAGIPQFTLDMILEHRDGYTFAQIAKEMRITTETCEEQCCQAMQAIISLPTFGLWETLIGLQQMRSWWLHVFWEEMCAAERLNE